MIEVQVKVKVGDKEIVLGDLEAKELFLQLSAIYAKKTEYVPIPSLPYTPVPYTPYVPIWRTWWANDTISVSYNVSD